jgi:hypothetical protein
MPHIAFLVVAGVCLLLSTNSFAFKLKFGEPLPDVPEARQSWTEKLLAKAGEPVHEALLRQTLGCEPEQAECKTGLEARGIRFAAVLRGIRWPDNPAFYVNLTPTGTLPDFCISKGREVIIKPGAPVRLSPEQNVICWAITMVAGQRAALEVDRRWFGGKRQTSGFALPLRSHYADMQFFHGMAPHGQRAGESYALIRAWSKLTYDVAAGRYGAAMLVKDIVEGDPELVPLHDYFVRDWRVADLFDFSDPDSTDARGIALGALLHMLQDSYATCHTQRRLVGGVARVERFLSYFGQDALEHARQDTQYNAFGKDPGPVKHGATIVRALGAVNPDFAEIRSLIATVFEPLDPNRTANAGPYPCAPSNEIEAP